MVGNRIWGIVPVLDRSYPTSGASTSVAGTPVEFGTTHVHSSFRRRFLWCPREYKGTDICIIFVPVGREAAYSHATLLGSCSPSGSAARRLRPIPQSCFQPVLSAPVRYRRTHCSSNNCRVVADSILSAFFTRTRSTPYGGPIPTSPNTGALLVRHVSIPNHKFFADHCLCIVKKTRSPRSP
jgi:hypothetical protein